MYPDFQSALAYAKGTGFSSEIYRTRSLQAATECLAALKLDKPIPVFYKQRSTYLPITVVMMLENKKQVNVLDFGGGLGIGYMTLAESMPADLKRISYNIVEVAEVCQTGMGMHGDGIVYRSDLPTSGKFDLIHASSSLQYVENWKELLTSFAALKPKYILLSDVFAGRIKSFVTLQNYYENKIPHWFLNLNELLKSLDSVGYRLAMKSYVTSRRLNVEDALTMDNFPEKSRLEQTLHLLFRKNK